jgi:hypothetical protein
MTSLKEETKEKMLPAPWNRIHGAIWLLGLAFIAWKNWWWPGILVLVAISALIQALMRVQLSKKDLQQQIAVERTNIDQGRAKWLPGLCPNCGGPLSISTVVWTGPDSADCPYCSAKLRKSGE